MTTYGQSPQDEGYSEDPLTVGTAGPMGSSLWLKSLPLSERTELALSIIDALPTSQVCEIVKRLRPRLYIDFFQYLPAEVCLKVLSYLDPVSLINTAQASHDWMVLSLDRRLWEELYILEGFRVIKSEVDKFEDSLNSSRRPRFQEISEEDYAGGKEVAPGFIKFESNGDLEMTDAEPLPVQRDTSIFGPLIQGTPDSGSTSHSDARMQSDQYLPPTKSRRMAQTPSRPAMKSPLQDHISRRLSKTPIYAEHYSSLLSSMSSLVVYDRGDHKKRLNWQYLFSQRRRLEANWEAARFVNFQLPHPKHPEEAHEECIYTIQYSGKYLVSGSRDRTLRIWDLDTRRLVRSPLRAHTGSVLCLQFDADPEEDLIVSGSSDATIVLWRFSTGQVIQRLRKAHHESVLNVRFNKRILVTCSKDKTIKIFNRQAMSPGQYNYRQALNPTPTVLNNYGFNTTPSAELAIKPPYSLIGCLEGHGAAVNAVQISGDEIVSASGDRTVKVWNWVEQTCTRTLIGHTKGIACVQYDGRRIVSGSSDNEVKVFDKKSGLEVASLRGHNNLVRTVQAGFGDLPHSEEVDQEEARMVDDEYFKALDAGDVSQNVMSDRRQRRNAGSRKPEHINAYGARVPPGGGGGRFGRIVSGSYDETIIIWRRDKEGVWKARHTLRQEDAARRAGRNTREIPKRRNRSREEADPTAGPSQAPPPVLGADITEGALDPGSLEVSQDLINKIFAQGPVAVRQALQAHPELLNHHENISEAIEALPYDKKLGVTAILDQAIIDLRQQQTGSASVSTTSYNHDDRPGVTVNEHPAVVASVTTVTTSSSSTIQTTASGQAPNISGASFPAVAVHQAPAAATLLAPVPAPSSVPIPAPATSQSHHQHLSSNMARVFKLQFDARRIICCSQTSTIVGWDFANDDEHIIDASRFFAPIE